MRKSGWSRNDLEPVAEVLIKKHKKVFKKSGFKDTAYSSVEDYSMVAR